MRPPEAGCLAVKHLGERLRPALIGHLERGHEVFAEPRRKRAKMLSRLVLVDLLIGSGGVCRLLACARVQLQRRIEGGVTLLQPKEHLIATLLVLEVRRFEGLQREEIKVTLRLTRSNARSARRRTGIRCARPCVPATRSRAPKCGSR